MIEIEKLKTLSFSAQLTFAYLTCERLYPNYVYFSKNFDFGDPLQLKQDIQLLYEIILGRKVNESEIQHRIKEMDNIAPDVDDFTNEFVSAAIDSVSSVDESFRFIIDKDFTSIKYLSDLGCETIFMYHYKLDDEEVMNTPLMKKEIEVQNGIIQFLERTKLPIGQIDMDTLLNLQTGRSNLGRSL